MKIYILVRKNMKLEIKGRTGESFNSNLHFDIIR